MNRLELMIGAYYLDENLWDDEHVRQLKEAGIGFLVGVPAREPLLSLCERYGIGIIATSNFPLWWGGTGETGGTYRQTMPFERFDEIVRTYKRHPAVWGDYPFDEPNDRDFDHMGRLIERYRKALPGLLPFINLHPYYEDVRCTKWLGAPYRQYLAEYLGFIPNDYIAFDIYPYSNNKLYLPTYFYSLDANADACRRSGRDLWVILQAGAWKAEDVLDESQIRLQANVALTYGARCILYASWSHGWWDESTSCVDTSGKRNPTADYVRTVNGEVHMLSGVISRYRNLGVTALGDIDRAGDAIAPQLHEIRRINAEQYGWKEFDLCREISADGALLCGCFEREDGGRAVMLTNLGDANLTGADAGVKLGFDAEVFINGRKTDDGRHFVLRAGDAAFVTFGGHLSPEPPFQPFDKRLGEKL